MWCFASHRQQLWFSCLVHIFHLVWCDIATSPKTHRQHTNTLTQLNVLVVYYSGLLLLLLLFGNFVSCWWFRRWGLFCDFKDLHNGNKISVALSVLYRILYFWLSHSTFKRIENSSTAKSDFNDLQCNASKWTFQLFQPFVN